MPKLSFYHGIIKGYPRLKKLLGEKVTSYIQLCRVFTILGAFLAGFFLDILFSRLSVNGLHLFHSILVGTTLAMLQSGGQILNQSIKEEVEIDILNGKKYRPVVNGSISLLEGKILSSLMFIGGILLAFGLNLNYGIFSLLIAFFAIFYTVPPLRMKKRFLLNNLWQGIARGLLPAVYVSSAYPSFGVLPVLFGVVIAIWVTGAQASKDFNDLEGDSKFNIKTFPVVLGKEGALKLMTVFGAISFCVLNLFVVLKAFPTSFLLLNVLAFPTLILLWSLKKEIKSSSFENNVGWGFFYGTLMLWYLFPVFLI